MGSDNKDVPSGPQPISTGSPRTYMSRHTRVSSNTGTAVLSFARLLRLHHKVDIATTYSIITTESGERGLDLFVAANHDDHSENAISFLQQLWSLFHQLADAVDLKADSIPRSEARLQIISFITRTCWKRFVYKLAKSWADLVCVSRRQFDVNEDDGRIYKSNVPNPDYKPSCDEPKMMTLGDIVEMGKITMGRLLREQLGENLSEENLDPTKFQPKSDVDTIGNGLDLMWACIEKMNMTYDVLAKRFGLDDVDPEVFRIMRSFNRVPSMYSMVDSLLDFISKYAMVTALVRGPFQVTWYRSCNKLDPHHNQLQVSDWKSVYENVLDRLCKTEELQEMVERGGKEEKVMMDLRQEIYRLIEVTHPILHPEITLFLGLLSGWQLDYICGAFGVSKHSCSSCYTAIERIWQAARRGELIEKNSTKPQLIGPRKPREPYDYVDEEVFVAIFVERAVSVGNWLAPMMEKLAYQSLRAVYYKRLKEEDQKKV